MKAVMYHYVREHDPALPHQRYLHVEDFVDQLEWLGREHGFVDREDFERAVSTGRSVPGVVLTFDDALRDHDEFVVPVLRARGLWGIFYAPTAPYREARLLDVHRLHHLTATVPGGELLARLDGLVDEPLLVHARVPEFRELTYGREDDDAATDEFKRVLNYFIRDDARRQVLDELVRRLDIDEAPVAQDYYVPASRLRELHEEGMVIGSHGDQHAVMSTLGPGEQHRDISTSVRTLSEIVGAPIETYCHPFGGFHTFDDHTEAVLSELGVRYAFNVEARDVTDDDLARRPMALPRYDCNLFPHGRASRGQHRPGRPA